MHFKLQFPNPVIYFILMFKVNNNNNNNKDMNHGTFSRIGALGISNRRFGNRKTQNGALGISNRRFWQRDSKRRFGNLESALWASEVSNRRFGHRKSQNGALGAYRMKSIIIQK